MKKIVSVFLIFVFLFSFSAQAELSVSWAYASSAGSRELTLAFDESWFAQNAREYRHELCLLSFAMALSAFRGSSVSPDREILNFIDSLGFADPAVTQFDVKEADSIGTAMAYRKIEGPDGAFPLVMIAVSGGNYGDEWISNFDVGSGETHRGFASAARKVVERAQEYVKARQLENPRFWLSGYSRGAAVSNLTAAFLSEDGLATDEFIFAYTFATPRTTREEEREDHPNIFNIVNTADMISYLPLPAWGFQRYGRTLYLPTSLDENTPYADLLPGYADALEFLTGQKNAQGDDETAPYTLGAIRGLSNAAGSVEKYEKNYRQVLAKAFTGRELTQAEGLQFVMLITAMRNGALQATGQPPLPLTAGMDQLQDSLAEMGTIFHQHTTDIYLSWLLALSDGNVLFHNSLTLTDVPNL